MRIGFCTCVQIGKSCIEEILRKEYKLELLLTLEDHLAVKKSGRIYLDDVSGAYDIPLLKINHINEDYSINKIKEYNLDWLFIIGWSQIASKAVLEAPAYGVIGAHPTLLPVGRGRAAIPWAIIKGLNKTGVTLFKMDQGVDTGQIIMQKEIEIDPNETATTLYKKVDDAHVDIVAEVFPKLVDATFDLQVQDESLATYWPGRKPEDGEIKSDFTVDEVDIMVRALTRPYPGAFLMYNGYKYIIWKGNKGRLGGFEIEFKGGWYTLMDYEIVHV